MRRKKEFDVFGGIIEDKTKISVLDNNSSQVNLYKNGKTNMFQFFVDKKSTLHFTFSEV